MALLEGFWNRPAAVLEVSGEDHLDFLQSQGTADVKGKPGLCRYSLWLDHKGLIRGDAFVLRVSESKAILVSYETAPEVLMEMFNRHIIADDVEIGDVTSHWKLLSVPAFCAGVLLAQRPRDLLPAGFITEAEGYLFSGHRLGPNTLEYLIPEETHLPIEFKPISIETAEKRRIEAGIPSIPRDIPPGRFNPIEAGLHQALCFEKGCFLGQEVVARVHRLQRVSRRLVRISTGDLPLPVDVPFPLKDREKEVGELTSVAKVSDTCLAIGWLKGKLADGEVNLSGCRMSVSSIRCT